MGTDKERAERRKLGKRKRARYRRRYLARFGREMPEHTGVIMNMSGSGIFLASTHLYRPGVLVMVDFTVDDASYQLEGVVQWARNAPANLARQIPSGMGIRIASPTQAYLDLVQRLRLTSPESIVR